MINEKIYLRDGNENVYMTTYIVDKLFDSTKKKPLVIVFPGGAYSIVAPHEGEPVALEFNAAGFNAAVVNYSVNTRYPSALEDASAAVAYVREHAEEWNTDPDKIFVCGFSAGAHLAASISIMNGKEEKIKRDDKMNKVNGMILCYPVISSGEKAHRGSFENIGAVTPEMLEKTSMELQVDENTPPAFIWHTFSDGAVPVENSLLLAGAMREKNIPFELHIYPEGVHGLSLASDVTENGASSVVPHLQSWMPLAKAWIKDIFG